MIFIDSNIWCYYFNERSKEHQKVATYLEEALRKKEIALNTIIVMEIAHYLIKNLGAIIGREKVNHLLSFPFTIEEFDHQLLSESLTLLAKYTQTGIGGRDASILATMKKLKINQLVTHDQSFKKIDFIEVIDPC